MAVSIALAVWVAIGIHQGQLDNPTLIGLAVSALAALIQALSYLEQIRPPVTPIAAQADDLAETVRRQWREEVRVRQLRDPSILPLTWELTSRPVGDDPAAIVGGNGRLRARLKLGGRLDGGLEEAAKQLAHQFGRLPTRRIVVLGEPGAGKSMLALILLLGIAKSRTAGDPVPVLLPASSWDPLTRDMDSWMVESIATAYYNGRTEIPTALVDEELIIPIVDGLDEIPEAGRRAAIAAINHAVRNDRPIAVTCRAVEYQDLIKNGSPVLRRSPVLEVAPLDPDDVVAYLAAVEWPAGTDWAAVYDELRERRGAPVSEALSTPLMVSLARLVFERLGGDPARLLDADAFDSRLAVENELVDRVIDAAYAASPGEPQEVPGKWNADVARGWLSYLARYLHRYSERELSWWRMSNRLLPSWAAPVVSIVVGALLTVAASVWVGDFGVGSLGEGPARTNGAVLVGSCVGGIFAVTATLAWYTTSGRGPGRLSITFRGSARRLWAGMRAGFAVSAIPGVPIVLTYVVTITVTHAWTLANRDHVLVLTAGLVLVAAALGAALAVQSWLAAPPERSHQISPRQSVAQDRRSALVSAVAGGVVFGVLALPALIAGMVAGSVVFDLLHGWSGYPGTFDVSTLMHVRYMDIFTNAFGAGPMLVGGGILLPCVVFVLLALVSTAWLRFLIFRIFLASRRQLPLRLPLFLADARERGLLRQSGGAYQFRHIRLQERLVGGQVPGDALAPPVARARRRRLAVGIAVVTTAMLAIALFALTSGVSRSWPIPGGYDRSPTFFAISDSQNLIALSAHAGNGVEVRDTDKGNIVAVLDNGRRDATRMWFSTDDLAAVIHYGPDDPKPEDRSMNCLWFWDLPAQSRKARQAKCYPADSGFDFLSADDSHLTVIKNPSGAGPNVKVAAEIWDNVSGKPVVRSIPGQASDSMGGLLFVEAGSGALQVWDPAVGRLVQGVGDLRGELTDISVSSDRREFLVRREAGAQLCTVDRRGDRTEVHLIHTFDQRQSAASMSFSPDGKRIVATGRSAGRNVDDVVSVWDSRGKPAHEFRNLSGVSDLAVSDDGAYLAAEVEAPSSATGRRLVAWDLRSGRQLASIANAYTFMLSGHTVLLETGSAVDRTGEKIDVTFHALRLDSADFPEVYDLAPVPGGKPVHVIVGATEGWVGELSPDRELFAVEDVDGVTHIWDLAANRHVDSFQSTKTSEDMVHNGGTVDFDPYGPLFIEETVDGVRLSGDHGNSASGFRDPDTSAILTDGFEHVGSDEVDHGEVTTFAFAPDKRTMAVHRSGSESLEIWDLRSLRLSRTLTGHLGHVKDFAYVGGGTRIITIGGDYMLRIWHLN